MNFSSRQFDWLGQLVEVLFFKFTETVGLLGTGAQHGHLGFHTAPELCWGSEGVNVFIAASARVIEL